MHIKSSKSEPFDLLFRCAVIIESCFERPYNDCRYRQAAEKIDIHRKKLLAYLAEAFITPLEREDLYLPMCVFTEQIQALGANRLPREQHRSLSACAMVQTKLFAVFREPKRPQAVFDACEKLRFTVQQAQKKGLQQNTATLSLLQLFNKMGGCMEYILLKNI